MSLPDFPPFDYDALLDEIGTSGALPLKPLVYLDLSPNPLALWEGEHDFESGGVTWLGASKAGLIGSVEGLESSNTLDGSDVQLTLSGVDPTILSLLDEGERADYVGRMAGFYLQMCGADFKPAMLGSETAPPFAIRVGFMGPLSIDRVWHAKDNGTGQWLRTMKMSAWNLFSGRSNPPNAFYTDRDQQNRHPGDLFCNFIPSVQETSIPQPWFKGAG